MEAFRQRFDPLLVFTCPCFDRIAVKGYLSMLSRPEHVVYRFRQVCGIARITKEAGWGGRRFQAMARLCYDEKLGASPA